MPQPKRVEVDVQGRTLSLSNLDKVLYPAAAFTKGHVIDYYTRIAPYVLPHLQGRALTLKRYPNGVEAQYFYEKNAPSHRPDWVRTATIPIRTDGRTIDFVLADDLPTLVWLANLADLELHTSLAKAADPRAPTILAFDLDPGPPATIVECARVALQLREVFEHLGLEGFPKTSGSKGMQVYVPLERPHGLPRDQALLAGDRAAAGAPPPRAGRLGDAQGPARGQGVRRLEPERRAQDDRRRLLAARQGAPDGVDPAALGGGRGGRRSPRIPASSCSPPPTCSSAWPPTATCSRRSRSSGRSSRSSRS